jgi:organic hydroperoxide reductase OsmC/OhrA
MTTAVDLRTIFDSSRAIGSAGLRTVTIDRTKEPGGYGLGFNGGELLLLAIGGCYSNDILELIQFTDRVAEIPNSLRLGTELKLAESKVIPLR